MNIITVPPLIEYSSDDQLQMNRPIHIQCSIQMIVLYNLNLI